MEVIVTDDGSIDDTADLARAAGATVVRKKNGGISSVSERWKFGTCSWTVYFEFLDGDDRLRPEALAVLLKALTADAELGAVFAMAKDFISPELSVEEQAKLRAAKHALLWLADWVYVDTSRGDAAGRPF